MPFKPARQCRIPYCPNLTRDASGFCDVHAEHRGFKRALDNRPSSTARGYGREWHKIRIEVLKKAGISPDLWPQYDVDHNPRYNPQIESDHRKYTLIPRLRGDHSRKTNREDGGYGHDRTSQGGGIQSLEGLGVNRSVSADSHSTDSRDKGVAHG